MGTLICWAAMWRLSAHSSIMFWLTALQATASRSSCRNRCCRGVFLAPISRCCWDSLRALLPAYLRWQCWGNRTLLCAVVLDGMTGTKHKATAELYRLWTGEYGRAVLYSITATAAIARSGRQRPMLARSSHLGGNSRYPRPFWR